MKPTMSANRMLQVQEEKMMSKFPQVHEVKQTLQMEIQRERIEVYSLCFTVLITPGLRNWLMAMKSEHHYQICDE